jgi:uncharacterized protein YdaU (DUF1376 family)
MSRAWIAFYMGDYQKDTNRLTTLEHGAYFLLLQECWTHGSIPLDPAGRAAIAKMPLKAWLKIAPAIDPYFQDDGTNKRATREIEKAEIVRTRRAIAGQRGGFASGISKAIAKHGYSKTVANVKQNTEQINKPSVANHNHIERITPTVSEDTAKGLANGEAPKRPDQLSRAELDALYAKRRTTA